MTRSNSENNQKINNILKNSIIFGVFLILFAPMIVANSNFFPFITGKAYWFRTIVEIISALWLILIIREPSYRPQKNIFAISVVILTVLALLSDLFGVNISRSIWSNYERMEGWVMIAHLCLYFFVTYSILKSRKIWNYWFMFTLGVSLLISAWGFFQYGCNAPLAGLNQTSTSSFTFCIKLSKSSIAGFFGGLQIMQGDRLNSTLGNAGYYGFYTMFHVFIAMLLLVRLSEDRGDYRLKILVGLAGIANLIALYFTATRGSVLGLIIGLILSALAYIYFSHRPKMVAGSNVVDSGKSLGRSYYVVLFSLITFIIVISSIWLARNSDLIKNTKYLNRYVSISINDTKSQARAYIWPMALKGFVERPILGWGQENFNYIFDKYYDSRMWAHEQWFDRAHNVFLDWLVSGGALGFLSYLILYFVPIFCIFRYRILSNAANSVFIGLLAAYGVHNMFIFDNIPSYILFFGLLAFFSNSIIPDKTTTLGQNADKNKFLANKDVVNYAIIPITTLLLVAALYFVNVRSVDANHNLLTALANCNKADTKLFSDTDLHADPIGSEQIPEQMWICAISILQSPNVPVDVKSKIFNTAMVEINEQLNGNPTARTYYFAGTILFSGGKYTEAAEAFAKASSISPNKVSIMILEAKSLLMSGRYEEGLNLSKRVYDLAPNYNVARLIYITSLVYNDKVDEALELAGSDMDILGDNFLINLLYEKKVFKKLIPIMQKRIDADPKNTSNYISLAALYLDPSINNRQAAREAVLKIKEVDPKNASVTDELVKRYNL